LCIIIFSAYIEKGNEKYHRHKFKRIHEIFAGNQGYDVLYIGSSRIHNAINPAIVDSITGLRSYNAGVEGGTMFEFKMTFDGYLIHHPAPGLLILAIDAKSFDIKRNIFYPPQYFHDLDNPVVSSSLGFKHNYELFFLKYFSFMRMLYYDDYTKVKAISGLMGQNEMQQLHSFEYNGFLSNGDDCIDSLNSKPYPVFTFQFQRDAVEWLQSIIDSCKKRNIRLLLTYAPEYKFKYQQAVNNFFSFRHLLDSMSLNNGISLFHDDSLRLCNWAGNFANPTHLNTQGSALYSVEIAKRVKENYAYSGNQEILNPRE
jgi:hypothetical protein